MDISKCGGNNSKLCDRCLRKNLIDKDEMQSFIAARAVGMVCDNFKPMRKNDNKKRN